MPTEIWFAFMGVRISSRLIGSEMRRLKRASTPSVGLKMARRSASSAAGTSSCRCTLSAGRGIDPGPMTRKLEPAGRPALIAAIHSASVVAMTSGGSAAPMR